MSNSFEQKDKVIQNITVNNYQMSKQEENNNSSGLFEFFDAMRQMRHLCIGIGGMLPLGVMFSDTNDDDYTEKAIPIGIEEDNGGVTYEIVKDDE